jgi:hypothetical protein
MTSKNSAQGIARCISIIAQDSAKIAVIDHDQRVNGITASNAEARASLVQDIEKHEQYLADGLSRWMYQRLTTEA